MYNEVNLLKGRNSMAGTKITMSLSEKTLNVLTELAADKGMKKSAIVALALDEYYKKQKGEVHQDDSK